MKRSISYVKAAWYFILWATSINSFAISIVTGPTVGGVTQNSARIFFKTDTRADVYVEYALDQAFSNPLKSSVTTTLFRNDFTTIIQLNELAPNTKYYYRVFADNVLISQQPYSFQSFPDPLQASDFSFAAFADVGNMKRAAAPAYASAGLDNPRFVIQLGDWDHRDPQTLAEMRQMHTEVLGSKTNSGRDFKNHLAKYFPLFHVWDDHDYGMENGDYTFHGKYDAIKAFKEYFPLPDLPNAEEGIWHSFRFAQSEFFMLDVRSNRDPNEDPDGPEKSILNGQNITNGQKQWLLDGLTNSQAMWKFIITGSNFNPTCKPDDSWGAFYTEWREIVDFIKSNNIENVIVLSGDLHSGGAFDDGTNSGVPEISVPNTNLNTNQFITTSEHGEWTGGLVIGEEQSGYVLVQIQTNPDIAIIDIKSEEGVIRKSFTLTPM